MGKSLVMPHAASFSTIRGEVPSLAISSPFSALVSTPSPSPSPGQGPAHDAGVDLNPRGAVEQWNARLGGSDDLAAGAWHGPGGVAGGESGATTRSLRYMAAEDEAEAARARQSREIIAAMHQRPHSLCHFCRTLPSHLLRTHIHCRSRRCGDREETPAKRCGKR
jgi:hypothetical protein